MSHPLLTAPLGASLLRLAGPTTAVMAAQTLVAIAETYFHLATQPRSAWSFETELRPWVETF